MARQTPHLPPKFSPFPPHCIRRLDRIRATREGAHMMKRNNMRPTVFAAAIVTVSALSLGGCATKDYVNQQVSAVDTKAQATQSQVDQQQTHLAQLDQT